MKLGDEYDDDLKDRLVEMLNSLGVSPLSSDWSVAGSQKLARLSVSLGGEVLCIESETYTGLSISGPDELIDQIVKTMGCGWSEPA